MSEQDRIAFEKWLKQNYPDYPPPLSEIWQAATAEAYAAKVLEDKERDIEGILDDTQSLANELLRSKSQITELQAKIEEKDREITNLRLNIKAQEQIGYELQASNKHLREVLEKLKNEVKHELNVSFVADIDKALSATPAQSMQSVINKTIEECANVADAWENISCKDKIRALKQEVK